jgi:hypothetical protein
MDVAFFIGILEKRGCRLQLEKGENGSRLVAIWYPSFAVEDAVEDVVTLLRRHRREVREHLARTAPLSEPAVSKGAGPREMRHVPKSPAAPTILREACSSMRENWNCFSAAELRARLESYAPAERRTILRLERPSIKPANQARYTRPQFVSSRICCSAMAIIALCADRTTDTRSRPDLDPS